MNSNFFPLKKFIACTLLIIFTSQVKAQDSLYVMLSKGQLPSWVNMTPERQLSIINADKKAQGYKLSKAMKNILSAITDIQYSYLRSGKLLFNDEASQLATTIAAKLLKGEVELRRSLKIYVAYTNTSDIIICPTGLMIIDLGLFAQLENEHQLAFMLSHELAHLNNDDGITSEAPVNFSPMTPELRNYVDYRRKRERAADSVGYEMYIKAGYAPGQALRTFDILGRNWLVPVPLAFSTLPFADSLNIATDTCSYGIYESDYYSSTQIEYSARKKTLSSQFEIGNEENKLTLPSPEFKHVNQLAIYNCGLYALQTGQTAAALYLGYYLHQTDSSIREEADLLIGKALYIHSALNSSEYEGYATETESESDNEIYFQNINGDKETSKRDERGFSVGAGVFLDALNPLELAIISLKWNWPYSLRTVRHKSLANELAGYSVNMLNMNESTPIESVGNIEIEKTVRIQLSPREDDEPTGDEQSSEKQKRENDELAELAKKAKRNGVDISNRIDSVKNARRQNLSTDRYKEQEFSIYNHELRGFEKDSAFIRVYQQNAPESASDELVAQPNVPMTKGDSIYLMETRYYLFEFKPGLDHLEYNYEKSAAQTSGARGDSYKAGKSHTIAVVSPGSGGTDSMSTTEYNAFCIACRIKSEAEVYKSERFTYPLAFKEEFNALNNAVKIRYFMTDFALVRHLNATMVYSYRETIAIDLVTGRKCWVLLRKGKVSIKGAAHMRKFFDLLSRKS